MKSVERDLRQAIESVAKPLGVRVEGPEMRGSGHFRWTLRARGRSTFFATGCTPRCTDVLIKKARSKARRACERLTD